MCTAQSRASYLIPQLFVELGYFALMGNPMDEELRSRSAAFPSYVYRVP